MTIYVTQYGAFWKLTETQWRCVVAASLCDRYVNYDRVGTRLKRRPSVVALGDDGSLYSTSNKHVVHRPLDWSEAAWLDQAYTLGIFEPEVGGKPAKPMIEISKDKYRALDSACWTMERETEAPYYWQLRSGDGALIARDQYQHDLDSRYSLSRFGRF